MCGQSVWSTSSASSCSAAIAGRDPRTAHGCRWLHYDRSPAGRSRWCTMGICGSRATTRAHRQRAR
ncbi:hypothetical protein C6361_16985 [Plantactinospora sp. BC1]|nr:hypothetical protein C6361_16985 [Plantactinospora sp. BC1]